MITRYNIKRGGKLVYIVNSTINGTDEECTLNLYYRLRRYMDIFPYMFKGINFSINKSKIYFHILDRGIDIGQIVKLLRKSQRFYNNQFLK